MSPAVVENLTLGASAAKAAPPAKARASDRAATRRVIWIIGFSPGKSLDIVAAARNAELLRGGPGEELPRERELGRDARVVRIELQRSRPRLAREARVHVAEVLIGDRVTGIDPHGGFQRGARLVELALARVQGGEVVVRPGQLGIVSGEL